MSLSPPVRSGDGGSPDWRTLWFERESTARVIVSRDLTVLAANASAQALIEGSEALSLRDGALAAKDRRATVRLAQAVASAGPTARAVVVSEPAGRAGVLLEVQALDERDDGPAGLMLRDLVAATNIECADLETMFGVTPGEHQVVVQLLKGYSSREIAAQDGKSILTIRTHVKRAYGKIGVKTRGQLFARLARYLSIR